MNNRYIPILLSLLLLATAGRAQSDDALAAGQRALRNDDVNSAKKFLETAYKTTPSDTAAILWLAEACLRGQDARRAEQVLEAGAKHHPDHPELLLKLGIAQNMRGRFKKAQESFEQAEKLLPADDPNRSTLYINLGIAIMNDDRPLDALQWFDRSIEINPRNATAQGYRGASLYRIGDYAEAINAYNTAIDIDSKNPISFYNRGMALLKNGDTTRGCQDFHIACKMGNINACKAIMVECAKK